MPTDEWLFPSVEEINQRVAADVDRLYDHEIAAIIEGIAKDLGDARWRHLGAIFHMTFHPHNVAQPFSALLILEGGAQSPIPDDLTDAQLNHFESIALGISTTALKAHLADILWLRRGNPEFARLAVKAYLARALEIDPNKHPEVQRCYERAVRLSSSLGKREPLAKEALDQLENHLLQSVERDEMAFWLHALCLLEEFKHGDFHKLGDAALGIANRPIGPHRRREYLEVAARLFSRAGKPEEALAASIARAKAFIEEADVHEQNDNHMAAHAALADAISAARKIPSLKDTVTELRKRHRIAGEKMLGQMEQIEVDIDISKESAAVQEYLSGKPFAEAIYCWCLLTKVEDPDASRAVALKYSQDHPIQAIITVFYCDGAGRKVDIRPSLMSDDAKERERGLTGLMHYLADQRRAFTSVALLNPGWHQIVKDHQPSLVDIKHLIEGSSFIVEGHESLWARAIQLALAGDIHIALHLMVTQSENSLRMLLHEAGIIAEKIDDLGIEEVWTLGKILSAKELPGIITPQIHYELRDLLIGDPGSNFRNLIAHGLMTEAQMLTPQALYIFWIIMALIISGTPGYREFAKTMELKEVDI